MKGLIVALCILAGTAQAATMEENIAAEFDPILRQAATRYCADPFTGSFSANGNMLKADADAGVITFSTASQYSVAGILQPICKGHEVLGYRWALTLGGSPLFENVVCQHSSKSY